MQKEKKVSKEDLLKEFKRLIDFLKEEAGYNYQDISQKIGISDKTRSNIYQDRSSAKGWHITKLREVFSEELKELDLKEEIVKGELTQKLVELENQVKSLKEVVSNHDAQLTRKNFESAEIIRQLNAFLEVSKEYKDDELIGPVIKRILERIEGKL